MKIVIAIVLFVRPYHVDHGRTDAAFSYTAWKENSIIVCYANDEDDTENRWNWKRGQ